MKKTEKKKEKAECMQEQRNAHDQNLFSESKEKQREKNAHYVFIFCYIKRTCC